MGSTFGSNSYELDSVDYSRSMRPTCCAVVASAQLGLRRGGGGAVLLTQAQQDRPGAAVLKATASSRSSTTDLVALLFALAALRVAGGAIECRSPPASVPAGSCAGEP